MWKDSMVLIVARFAICLVNLSKKICFFLPESFCPLSEENSNKADERSADFSFNCCG